MKSPPNIVHISTHDSGRFYGCYGVDTVHTPWIDRLAREGVLAERMFAVSPICSPSRGAAMTGQYPQRNGLIGLTHQGYSLNEDAVHLAEHLQAGGYETTLFSFQHETGPESWQRLGFEDYQSPSAERFPYPYMFRPAPEVGACFAEWLRKRRDGRPFYAQIGFNESHTPFHFGGAYPDDEKGISISPQVERDATSEDWFAHLQGALRQADMGVARILQGLDAAGCAENTIVVFTTDHGIEAPRAKWSLYDAGIEIAFTIRWPAGGLTGERRLQQVQSNVDLTPTLLDLVGVPAKAGVTFDGVSQAAWLRGESPDTACERPFFGIYHNGSCRCIRTDRYKMVRSFGSELGRIQAPVRMGHEEKIGPPPPRELFDLANDPLETNNLHDHPDYTAIAEDLDNQLFQWLQEVDDPILRGPEPSPYYAKAIQDYLRKLSP